MIRREFLKWFTRLTCGYFTLGIASPLTRINTTLFQEAEAADTCTVSDTSGECSVNDTCDTDSSGACSTDTCTVDSSLDCTASDNCVSDKSAACSTNDDCVSDASGECGTDSCNSDSSASCGTSDDCHLDASGSCLSSDVCTTDESGYCQTADTCLSDRSTTCTTYDNCSTDASGECTTNDDCNSDNSATCATDSCVLDSSGACSASDSCTSDSSNTCSTSDNCTSDNSGECVNDKCNTDGSGNCTAADVCGLDKSSFCASDLCREDQTPLGSECSTSDACALDTAGIFPKKQRTATVAGLNRATRWLYKLSLLLCILGVSQSHVRAATVIDATNTIFSHTPTFQTAQSVSVASPVGPFLRDCNCDGILEADVNGDGLCLNDPEVKDYNNNGSRELPPGTLFSGSFEFTCFYIPDDVLIESTGALTVAASEEVAVFGALRLTSGARISCQNAINLTTGAWLSVDGSTIEFITTQTGDVDTTQTAYDSETSIPDVDYTTVCSSFPQCPECSGDPVVLTNVTFSSSTACECTAETAITVGSGVIVENGALVHFFAPNVKIQNGAKFESGSNVCIKQR